MQLHTLQADDDDDDEEEQDQRPLQAPAVHRPFSSLAPASSQLHDLSCYFGHQNSRFSTSLAPLIAAPSCCSVFPHDRQLAGYYNLEEAATLAGPQEEHQFADHELLGALVSPPTMHPNLVATLRSLLSPPRSPLSRFNGDADHTDAFHAASVKREDYDGQRVTEEALAILAVKRENAEEADTGMEKESARYHGVPNIAGGGGKRESEGDAADGLMEDDAGWKRENAASYKGNEAVGKRESAGYNKGGEAVGKREITASSGGKRESGDGGSLQHCNVGDKDINEEDEVVATVVPVDLIRNRRPFTCSYDGCNKTFKNPQTMRMHYKTHYPGTDVCKPQRRNISLSVSADQQASANNNGSINKAGHNKKIPSRCPLCRKTFVGLYELRRHFGRKHSEGEKSHACRKCNKKFYIEVDLRDHEKLCGEPMHCKCGMKFAFKCNLVVHKKAHPECQDPTSLNIHSYTHTPLLSSNIGHNRITVKPHSTSITSISIPSSAASQLPLTHTCSTTNTTIYSHKPQLTHTLLSTCNAFSSPKTTHHPLITHTTANTSSLIKPSQFRLSSTYNSSFNCSPNQPSAFSANKQPPLASVPFYDARLETFKNVSDAAKFAIATSQHESHSPCASSSKGSPASFLSFK